MPDMLTIWFVAIVAISGLMYVLMSMSTRSATTSRPSALATRRPGGIARRRARGGVKHPQGGAGLGYESATSTVALSAREFTLGGLCLGAPGSGKTTLAKLLVQALARHGQAGVILDPKP